MANYNPPTNGLDKRPQDRNINGRPKKGTAISDILRYELNQTKTVFIGGKETKIYHKHKVVQKLIEMAENGDIAAIKYLIDRIEGKPVETVKSIAATIDMSDSKADIAIEAAKKLIENDG